MQTFISVLFLTSARRTLAHLPFIRHRYDRYIASDHDPKVLEAVALVALAVALCAASIVAWALSLRVVPLSLAFMFNVISFALVPAAGFLIFGGLFPRFFWLGSIFILVGLALILVPCAALD